ncbi:hypothetical protein D3C72_1941400 [compost metagenome]
MGTLYFSHSAMSCSRRSLVRCTIWLMANGAAGLSGLARLCAASSSVISASQSSSCSAGRALSAGMEPTMPALHCAITNLGLLMMKSGEPITGNGTCFNAPGSWDMGSPSIQKAFGPANGRTCKRPPVIGNRCKKAAHAHDFCASSPLLHGNPGGDH